MGIRRVGEVVGFNVKAMNRVFLVLVILVSALMGDRRQMLADETTKTIVVLGDSLAAGLGVEREEAFPSLLQDKIDAVGLPYRVLNAGFSGDTTAGGLRRLAWVLKRKPDVFVLELGGNDGLRGLAPEETKKNLNAIIDRVRRINPEAVILLSGMQMPQNMGEEYTSAFRALFPAVAQDKQVALIPFLLEGVGGVPALNQGDMIHPNAKGHELVAENVWRVLEPLLLREVSRSDR